MPSKTIFIRAQNGFTLVELVVTVAVLGVLMAVAAPNLSAFVVNNRLSSNVNGFLGMITYARSEAIARNKQVIICAKDNANNNCVADSLWGLYDTQLFVDEDGNNAWSAGDTLLKTIPAVDTSNSHSAFIRQTVSQRISFQSGGLSSTNHRFDIHALKTPVDAAYEARFGRTICISNPGRARVVALQSGACNAF